MPNIVVIAGANGAGKSTLAPYLLRDTFGILEYVNADTIALGLSAFAPERAAFAAGRVMLRRLNELASEGRDFAFETTLASRSYAAWLKTLQANGYEVNLIFLLLRAPELAVQRVRERVRAGGHDVPEDVVRRRYAKGVINFFRYYKPLADSWIIYEASDQAPAIIGYGSREDATIVNQDLWMRIQTPGG